MINLTNNAIERLKGFLEPDNIVRLSIQGGGCAGFEYKFGVQPKEDAYEDDTMLEFSGVKLCVDPVSYTYLENVEIDYEENLLGSRFKINNPDAVGTCGCGSSFY